ncbi:unnamed protein product [Didymodactylos carnosus]|uniref:Uncharacterized protein n=1 Tax=Didymodactylos carnosus TaxID=1234261 RepID=A0A815MLW9_9BILA|nr:unnamed protein product [Didymodactylos carnosus]CAF1425052.1 unnamed protein product [Didymodactylos carnosus]CAF4208110.1 unnamed protein product [Didymodactylos carnosus]CAF4306153.1 unnamed protein product [Didymodactylos carnosus]
MANWLSLYFIVLTSVLTINSQVQIPQNFIPFGGDQGDQKLARPIDTISSPIPIKIRFPYFNEKYDIIHIYSSGLILFGNRTYVLPHNSPGPFPLKDFICVAPYSADTDQTVDPTSDIFYREIDDTSTLRIITEMVKTGFPTLVSHTMLWAYVVTWYKVPPGHGWSTPRNTFQAIITTNGIYSFTIFTYYKLEWSAGAWGGYPQVEFNAGDQENYYTIEKSFSPNIQSIVDDSNIGVQGQFIFHTTGDIGNVECNTKDGLLISPYRGLTFGGYDFRLYGICFNETSYIVEIDNHVVDTCEISLMYIVCTMPMLYDGPTLLIKLYNSNRTLIASTEFIVEIPPDNSIIYLAFHTLGTEIWRLTLNLILDRKKLTESTEDCKRWHSEQLNPESYIEQIPTCFCRVPSTGRDPFPNPLPGGTFQIDSGCDFHKDLDKTCAYHQGARGCYREQQKQRGPGAQCCYDSNGRWINNPKNGGGTLDVQAPTGSLLQILKHHRVDVAPFYWCCRGGQASELCQLYFEKRPAGKCENEILPILAGGNGDSHFLTLDGTNYTFSGYGEYVLLNIENILEVQVRLAPIASDELENQATSIVAFVIKNRNYARVQFELFQSLKLVEIRVNNRLIESNDINDEHTIFNFGESWRTTSNMSLFYYIVNDNHDKHQNLNYRPILKSELFEKYQNSTRLTIAQQTCEVLSSSQQKEQCVYDVLITNDKTMLKLHQDFHTSVDDWKEYADLVEQELNTTTTTISATKAGSARLSLHFSLIIFMLIIIQ